MFARLLVGLDGSRGADAALEAAIALGKRFHSTIELATVVDSRVLEAPLIEAAGSGWPDAISASPASLELGDVLTGRADELLAEGAAKVTAAGLVAEPTRTIGLVEEELLHLAERAEALVVGRRGEAHGETSLGAHTVKLIRRCPRPVVVAGVSATFARPVVAYDGGETSSAALALAARYAAAAQLPLDVVHVGDDGGEMLARASAFLSAHPTAFETHQLGGDIAVALAAHAEAFGDMIVCGAHGSKRRSWSMGSHVEQLLKATALPVIVVR